MLALRGLTIGYGTHALAQLPDIDVRAGDFVCVLGRNGQGKSTLLRTLGGFLAPVAGTVALDGTPLRALSPIERARRVAVVLTERPQLGALDVLELVEMGRQPHTGWVGVLSAEDRRIAVDALERVGGGHLAGRAVDSLSDGERQRVMIARALAQQPRLLLLDEITAFLDLPSRVTIIDLLRRIAREQGVAIVLSRSRSGAVAGDRRPPLAVARRGALHRGSARGCRALGRDRRCLRPAQPALLADLRPLRNTGRLRRGGPCRRDGARCDVAVARIASARLRDRGCRQRGASCRPHGDGLACRRWTAAGIHRRGAGGAAARRA